MDIQSNEKQALVSSTALTDNEILDYVRNHVDGFTYCQLQTGISKNELLRLLDTYGFEQCDNCVAWEEGLHPCRNMYLCSDCFVERTSNWT
jgi:translation initiation factor 2 beta subunit (eIF-2beta)/eIF-5